MSIHGKDAYFAVEDSAGTTLRNISSDVTTVNFDQSNDIHDNTTFGAEGHTFQGGLTSGKITVNGWFTVTASTGTDTVLRSLVGHETPVDFEYGPEGNASGARKKSGACVLESYNVSNPVADLVSFTAAFQISGSVTEGTFA